MAPPSEPITLTSRRWRFVPLSVALVGVATVGVVLVNQQPAGTEVMGLDATVGDVHLIIDGALVASYPLTPGPHTLNLVVDGLLDESFQVEVPNPVHMVIDTDTTLTNTTLVLRPGDSIEFRNGARLTIGDGASVDWQGTPTETWSGDGTTQNLERDIDIFGQGDIMFVAGSKPSTIRFVEVDLQPTAILGHYPLHWHQVGDGSRGTLVEGVVVRGSTNRAYVPHASHGITFRDTIAKDTAGEPYWWDPPLSGTDMSNNSEDTIWEHALVDGVTNAVGDQRGYLLSGFTLGAGTGNVVRDSVARNIHPSNVKDCSGFEWPSHNINQPGVWVAENLAVYNSDCHGIFVWQNTGQPHIVEGFVSPEGILHGAYTSTYEYRNIEVPYVIVHARGWSVTGGSIGEVRDVKHQTEGVVTFTDVEIGRFLVDNNNGTSPQPMHYILTNVGMDCSDIVWTSWVPGTSIVIDGGLCRTGG